MNRLLEGCGLSAVRAGVKFLICLFLSTSITLPVCGAAPDTVQVPSSRAAVSTAQPAAGTSAPTTAPRVTEPGIIFVRLLVPQKQDCVDSFIIYPYPVRPPKNEKKLKPLPKNMKQLRDALFSTGYSARVAASKVYPAMGWRWTYILRTAVEKSKSSFPNNVTTAYGWVDDMVPYVIPELKKVNAAERVRIARYDKAFEFWDLNGVDLENAATLSGQRPHEITFDKKEWVAHTRLPEGLWWVVGTHRIVGLVFYWQEPVKVTAGKICHVNLDEWNALVVQGAW